MSESSQKIARYIVSGGTGAAVNIGTLFILVHWFGVWYLAASITGFLVSFFVSFTLQRYWTFGHRTAEGLGRHATLYLATLVFNAALNTGIVYVLVHLLSTWYVLAQLIAGLLVALASFFIYRSVVFREPASPMS